MQVNNQKESFNYFLLPTYVIEFQTFETQLLTYELLTYLTQYQHMYFGY